MSEHNDPPRHYSEPAWVDGRWIIVETDDQDFVTAEFGYPTEAAARAAYRMLVTPTTGGL